MRPRTSGIFENVNNELDADIEFTNSWRSPLADVDENGEDGKYIIVQVGSMKNDPEQGVAVVCHQSKDSDQYIIDEKFLTPSKYGAIKIKSLGAKDFTMSVVAVDGARLIIWTDTVIKDFAFITVDHDDTGGKLSFLPGDTLFSVDELSPEKPFVVKLLIPGSTPAYGISFMDGNGVERYFSINLSGRGADEALPYYLT